MSRVIYSALSWNNVRCVLYKPVMHVKAQALVLLLKLQTQ